MNNFPPSRRYECRRSKGAWFLPSTRLTACDRPKVRSHFTQWDKVHKEFGVNMDHGRVRHSDLMMKNDIVVTIGVWKCYPSKVSSRQES